MTNPFGDLNEAQLAILNDALEDFIYSAGMREFGSGAEPEDPGRVEEAAKLLRYVVERQELVTGT
jgi:hypothetical protein